MNKMNKIIDDGELKKLDIKLINTADLKYPPRLLKIETKIRKSIKTNNAKLQNKLKNNVCEVIF